MSTSRKHYWFAGGLLAALVLPVCGFAQPPATAPPVLREPAGGTLVRESELPIRVLDDDGMLVLVPGITREELDELLKLNARLKNQQPDVPRVTFVRAIELTGSVEPTQKYAELEAVYQIHVAKAADSSEAIWTAVPLGLNKAFVDVASLRHEEPGEAMLHKDGEAFLCWLRAPPDTTHTLRIRLKLPLVEVRGETTLAVQLPNISAKVMLRVPGSAIDARTADALDSLTVTPEAGNQTLLTVENGGGGVELAWREKRSTQLFLESAGNIVFHVVGQHVWAEAKLKVRSHGEPIDSFVVSLPSGMELTSQDGGGYQFTVLPGDSPASAVQKVRVRRIEGATQGTLEVDLQASMAPVESDQTTRVVQANGFEVEGAARQWGSIECSLEGNWAAKWVPGQFVQRVSVPAAANRSPPIAARFLYDRQPCNLRVELRQKQPRIAVDAKYVIDIAAGQAKLEARLHFATSGTRFDEVSLLLPGWQVEQVLPAELLVQPQSMENGSLLRIPLANAPTEFNLQVTAVQTFTLEGGTASIALPRPTDSALLPTSTVAVLSADNLEVIPQPSAMRFLIPETQPPAMELPPREAVPFFFREELTADNAEPSLFVAQIRNRPREVTVAVDSFAQIRRQDMAVTQEYALTISNEPLKELLLEMPPALALNPTLRVRHLQEDLSLRWLSAIAEAETPTTSLPSQAIVELGTERMGALNLTIQFSLPTPKRPTGKQPAATADEPALVIPLAAPVEENSVQVTSNLLRVVSDANAQIELEDVNWSREPTADSTAAHPSELRARAVEPQLSATIREIEATQWGHTTLVSQAWVQVHVTPTGRNDRVCFQFVTSQPQLRLRLPPSLSTDGMSIAVNGVEPLNWSVSPERILTVALGEQDPTRKSTLELWYSPSVANGGVVPLSVTLPSLLDTQRIERVYWQLVLPKNRHLAWAPARLTSELIWQFEGLYWGRRGRLEQASLEELVGASHQDEVSPNTNRYLFSSTGSVAAVDFTIISRVTLMLACSGAVLVVLLPWLYWPVLRQQGVLLFAGVLLVALAITFPEVAALAGQAGAAGLSLALLAAILYRLFAQVPVTTAARPSGIYMPPDSHPSTPRPAPPSIRLGEGSSRGTTATAPAHLQVAQAAQAEVDS